MGLERSVSRHIAGLELSLLEQRSNEAPRNEGVPGRYRALAEARLQIIQAFLESSLPVKEFMKIYAEGKILPEIHSMLGPRRNFATASTLYLWLARYDRYGLKGLVPGCGEGKQRRGKGGKA